MHQLALARLPPLAGRRSGLNGVFGEAFARQVKEDQVVLPQQ